MAINLFRHIFRSLTPYYDYSYFIGTFSCNLGIKMSFKRKMYLPFVPLTSKPLLIEYVFAKAAFNIYTRLFCSEVPGPENHSGKMSAEEVFKSY